MSRVLALSLLLPTLLLGGCSVSLFGKPPPTPYVYALDVGEVQRLSGDPIDAVVVVSLPRGDATILGSELMIRNSNEYKVIGQSLWSSPADTSLQTVAAQTITRQGRFRSGVATGGASANYEVRWDVLSFNVEEEGTRWTARFVADVRIVDAGRNILATETVNKSVEITEHRSSVVAQALASAARQGSARIGEIAAQAIPPDIARRAAEAEARRVAGQPPQREPATVPQRGRGRGTRR